jgi:hypothetical protein
VVAKRKTGVGLGIGTAFDTDANIGQDREKREGRVALVLHGIRDATDVAIVVGTIQDLTMRSSRQSGLRTI